MIARPADLVLEHLRELGGNETNALELGHKLGLSAGDVHAAVETLREAGWDVRHVGHGYALVGGPEKPLDQEIRELTRTKTVARHFLYFEETTSTSDVAREEGERGAPHGTAVVARRQTAGRGRRGRSWLTLAGDNLQVSIVLRPTLPPERLQEISIVAGVALAEALERVGVPAELKWPNDVEVDGRKIAGILCELATDAHGTPRFVVLGVGVNVTAPAESFPEELKSRATSVAAATGKAASVAAVAAAFFEELEEWLVLHGSLGFEAVLDSWRARSSTLNAEIHALVEGQVIAGVAEDLDATGALLVRDAQARLHRIVAGEVTTVRKAR